MDYFETLERWAYLQEAKRAIDAEEKALREGLFNGTFPNPREGSNTVLLPDGRRLRATHKVNRNVIEENFLNGKFHHLSQEAKLEGPIKLFKTKHELILSAYRELTPEQQKIIDGGMLIIKPGLPQLEILPAKE